MGLLDILNGMQNGGLQANPRRRSAKPLFGRVRIWSGRQARS